MKRLIALICVLGLVGGATVAYGVTDTASQVLSGNTSPAITVTNVDLDETSWSLSVAGSPNEITGKTVRVECNANWQLTVKCGNTETPQEGSTGHLVPYVSAAYQTDPPCLVNALQWKGRDIAVYEEATSDDTAVIEADGVATAETLIDMSFQQTIVMDDEVLTGSTVYRIDNTYTGTTL